jgi:hypothetical protein
MIQLQRRLNHYTVLSLFTASQLLPLFKAYLSGPLTGVAGAERIVYAHDEAAKIRTQRTYTRTHRPHANTLP